MNIVTVASLGEPVGKLWLDLQKTYAQDGIFNVASPLSSTPLPIYQWIIDNADRVTFWDNVRFVLMDEQIEVTGESYRYVSMEDSSSYEGFARKHFLSPLNRSIEVLKPDLDQLETFNPPLDLLVLSLGVRGNYANVMPGTSVKTGWHITKLTPEFRQSHTGKASTSYMGAKFREYGMSLGPRQVLDATHVIVVISGPAKRQLTQKLLSYTNFDPAFPLSIVHHPEVNERVSLYITEDVLGHNQRI